MSSSSPITCSCAKGAGSIPNQAAIRPHIQLQRKTSPLTTLKASSAPARLVEAAARQWRAGEPPDPVRVLVEDVPDLAERVRAAAETAQRQAAAKGVVGRSLDAGTDLGRVEPGVDEGRDAHLPEQSLGGLVSLRRRTDHREPAASKGLDGLPIQPADVRPDDGHVTVAGRRGAEQVREVRASALHADPWDLI